MAAAAYYVWDRLGRPAEPATPIREFIERMRLLYPGNIFSWYANEEHYQAEPPQDHTPFSETGYPVTSPRWVVFATDVMHRPSTGVDCHVLFAYWIAEARAGRMPWLKYIIWQAKIYDVRNDWKPQLSAGHYEHIHLSGRTDHRYYRLGSWPVSPKEDDLNTQEHARLINTANITAAIAQGRLKATGLLSDTGQPLPDMDLTGYYNRVADVVIAKLPANPPTGGEPFPWTITLTGEIS